MKLNISCEQHKPLTKSGQKDRCACAFLNRRFQTEVKLYRQFMSQFDKPVTPRKKNDKT